jgi:probable F420-dependent oxidoreductase
MELGRIGLFAGPLDTLPANAARAAAAELENLGFRTLWISEGTRRDVFVNSFLLLSSTERAALATGIASIYARDAIAMALAQRTLAEAFPRRFLLGIGVSHRSSVEELRGHVYGLPVPTMRSYLDQMDRVKLTGIDPPEPPRRVVAALGPSMLRLAARRAWGAHPFFVPVEHTRWARHIIGPDALLAVHIPFVVDTDRNRAREVARSFAGRYLRQENYANNLRRLGFADAELVNGGSDRLVDATIAMGTVEDVERRVREHLEAGADHVCLQAVEPDPNQAPWEAWKAVVPLL